MLDGELLVMREGEVAPFNDLQQRLNRKTVTAAMLTHPAFIRLYDMLFEGGEDLRAASFRRAPGAAEAWHGASARAPTSPLIVVSLDQGAGSALGGARADRHRGTDAEAPRQPLCRRPPQGPLV